MGQVLEALALEFSDRASWVGYFALASLIVLALHSTYVFDQLSTIRPMIIFVSVDGAPPPICGLCVLFG